MEEVRIYRRLIKEIEGFIKARPELGYVDAEDFIRDALRHFLFHREHTA